MIYAINKRTKQHNIATGSVRYDERKWDIVQADPDGWIPWDSKPGAECPLPEYKSVRVAVKLRNGIEEEMSPESFRWSHMGRGGDIIAYRPILDASEPEAPEWDGEGLPPVGIDCDVYEDQKWQFATVVAHHDDAAIVAIHNDDLTYSYGAFYGGAIRPIRTPAQRAEEAIRRGIVESLSVAAEEGRDVLDDDVCASVIASAIRDGKIPGVKLEDE